MSKITQGKEYPQTRALTIGKYGCLAMCYLFCANVPISKYYDIISKAMDCGILDNECTVLDASKFIEFTTGKKCTVTKEQFLQEDLEKEMHSPTARPVRFDYKGNSHWVVVEKGLIVFNSLEHSVCVEKGFPSTQRIIKWTSN